MARKTNTTINGQKYYRITADIGIKSDGTRKRKVFYGNSQRDAEQKRDEHITTLKKGLSAGFEKVCLGPFMKEWLFTVEKNRLKPSSFERYDSLYRTHIKPSEIYGLRVCEIKSIHLQKYYNALIDAGKHVPTVQAINKLLKKFFNYCVKEDLIIKNPCGNVNLPKDHNSNESTIEVFTADEITAIKSDIQENKNHFIFLFALVTGMCMGEILALTLPDIDIDGRKIHVVKSAKHVTLIDKDENRSYKRIVQKPKSKKSVRIIPFPENMLPHLLTHIKNEKLKHLKVGVLYTEGNLLFTNEFCRPYDESNLRITWMRFQKRLNIPQRKFHTLRHTYCTMLAENGVDLKTASELMGNDILMTSRVYTQVSDARKVIAVEKINHMI